MPAFDHQTAGTGEYGYQTHDCQYRFHNSNFAGTMPSDMTPLTRSQRTFLVAIDNGGTTKVA
jgi:hypothetical protein